MSTLTQSRLFQSNLQDSSSDSPDAGSTESSSNSLITLLNFAQEVGSSSNVRFRQNADRLRTQFVKSFTDRYSLAQDLIADLAQSLSNVDNEKLLSPEAMKIKQKIIEQLDAIDRLASDIIFYNEPLANLEQLRFTSGFPLEALVSTLPRDDQTRARTTISEEIEEDSASSTNSRMAVEVLRRAKVQRESRNPSLMIQQQDDLRRLKTALRLETQKWRYESAGPRAELALIDPVVDSILGGSRIAEAAALRERADKHAAKATYARWRDAMEQIDGAIGRNSLEPNFAKLTQSALFACLATYNLRLTPLSITSLLSEVSEGTLSLDEAGIDTAKKAIQAVADAAQFDTLAGPGVQGLASLAESALDLVRDAVEIESTKSATDDEALANEANRVDRMARLSIGNPPFSETQPDAVKVHAIQSGWGCASVTFDPAKLLAVVAFRGTKDPVDLITDISFLSAPFEPEQLSNSWDPWGGAGKSKGGLGWKDMTMEVHSGFLSSFESLRPQLSELLNPLPDATQLVFTGHSMGGALAQIASAFYSHRRPHCVTFGAPSIGNAGFCKYLEDFVQPCGGLRVWNEYDAVPYLALVVGYEHAGIPIKTSVGPQAKALYLQESINPLVANTVVDLIAPHILYQVGGVVSAFPVLGTEETKASTAFAVVTDGDEEQQPSEVPTESVEQVQVVSVVGVSLPEEFDSETSDAAPVIIPAADPPVARSAPPPSTSSAPSPPPSSINAALLRAVGSSSQMPEKISALELIKLKQSRQAEQTRQREIRSLVGSLNEGSGSRVARAATSLIEMDDGMARQEPEEQNMKPLVGNRKRDKVLQFLKDLPKMLLSNRPEGKMP